jgi:trimeric autotransporter adhesin
LLNGTLIASLGAGPPLRIPLVPGTASFGPLGTVSPLGPVSGTSYLSADGTFFYANLMPVISPTEREFVAGGLPASASSLASAPIAAFAVQPDAALQSNIPFIRNDAGGNLANAYVSPLFIAPHTSATLQSSLAINGLGADQQSVLVTAIGNAATLQSSGMPMLSGVVRGSSQLSALGPSLRIGSNFASVVDGSGNSLYGAQAISGFVLDQTRYASTAPGSTGLTTPVIPSTASEVPLQGAATNYGFTQPATPTNLPVGVGVNRTSQSLLRGHFGGLMNTTAQAQPYAITGRTALSTNADTNRITAVLTSQKRHPTAGISSVTMAFGPGNSAFIDNNIYGAAENRSTPATINGKPAQAAQLYLLSSGAAPPPTSLLPSGASYCQCQYLQWGYWGGDITTANPNGGAAPRIDRGNINFWTAGQITPAADINKLAAQGAVGNYSGHMIGSVFNNGAQYVAAGGVAATYNFGTQAGSFSVINYDGRSFTTAGKPITQGANYKFGITDVPGITGAVKGSFYGPMAAETGGNFTFRTTAGPTYLTSGIFAAKR